MDPIIERIQDLIEINNDKPAPLMQEIGLSSTSFSSWKIGRAKPSTEAIIKIAEHYNVSTDYILLGKISDEETGSSIVQKQLNTIFVQLDEGDQRECLGFAKGLLHANNTEKILVLR